MNDEAPDINGTAWHHEDVEDVKRRTKSSRFTSLKYTVVRYPHTDELAEQHDKCVVSCYFLLVLRHTTTED